MIEAGIATVDVTPPVGAPLAGYTARGSHSSTGVYHPLRAVALSLGDGRHDLIVISIEWIGADDGLVRRLVGAIAGSTGLAPAQIMISSTHTHTGPAVRTVDRQRFGWIDESHVDTIVRRVGEAAGRAHRHRFRADLGLARQHCTFAVNRRRLNHDGRAEMRPNPEGITDHEVSVLTIRSTADHKVRGVAFSYACHPTSRGGLLVGGDYIGHAYDAVQEAFPLAQPMFLQGCAGDQKPGPVDAGADRFSPRTLAQVTDLGSELAEAVVSAVAGTRPIRGPLRVARGDVVLRTAGDPTRGRAVAAVLDLQVIRFGSDLLVIGMGGEMTVEHGLRLKRRYRADGGDVIPLGYTNTMIGYVPVARQYGEGGYEVVEANRLHGYAGPFLPRSEEDIHAAIDRLVRATDH